VCVGWGEQASEHEFKCGLSEMETYRSDLIVLVVNVGRHKPTFMFRTEHFFIIPN